MLIIFQQKSLECKYYQIENYDMIILYYIEI